MAKVTMRLLAFLQALVFVSAPLAAQSTSPAQAVFGPEVQHFATGLHLDPLVAGLEPGTLEIRIWQGFGLTGVKLHRIRRENGLWSGHRYYPVDRPARLKLDSLIDLAEWSARWASAVQAGIWSLPPSPQRPGDYVPRDDGWSFVVEVAEGRRYHISGADNPQYACSADDRHLLRVIHALLGSEEWQCPTSNLGPSN